jgi:hypothetical protein
MGRAFDEALTIVTRSLPVLSSHGTIISLHGGFAVQLRYHALQPAICNLVWEFV